MLLSQRTNLRILAIEIGWPPAILTVAANADIGNAFRADLVDQRVPGLSRSKFPLKGFFAKQDRALRDRSHRQSVPPASS